MSESTLAIKFDDLVLEVAYSLGYGRTALTSTDDHYDEVKSAIDTGLRQFYYPLPIGGRTHQWSFLKPIASLNAFAAIAENATTVTIAAVADSAVQITATAAAFYSSMVGSVMTVAANDIPIILYGSTTVLLGGPSGYDCVGKKFAIATTGDYQLPDDFGSICGPFTYTGTTAYAPIPVVSEAQIRRMRQGSDTTGFPKYAAIRPKKPPASTGVALFDPPAHDPSHPTIRVPFGQRFEVMVWPTPDQLYELEYRYNILPNALTTDAFNEYPAGGAAHSETILASCLAAAERRIEGTKGQRWEEFMGLLAGSIARDRVANVPEYLGRNLSEEGVGYQRYSRAPAVTYNGVAID